MQPASFARNQRLFGQRDWSAGEPYRVGNLQLGVATPEGAIEMHRRPRCIEPAEPWHGAALPPVREEIAAIDRMADVAAGLGLLFLVVAVALSLLLIDGVL